VSRWAGAGIGLPTWPPYSLPRRYGVCRSEAPEGRDVSGMTTGYVQGGRPARRGVALGAGRLQFWRRQVDERALVFGKRSATRSDCTAQRAESLTRI